MGKDFAVACPADEEQSLLEAARYLDTSMKEIRSTGKIIGTERCAIMAALNITNDLLKLQSATKGQENVKQKLVEIQSKIDEVLKTTDQI